MDRPEPYRPKTKRGAFSFGRAGIPGLCLTIVLVGALFLTPEPEPRYRGRTLTQWLHTPPPVRYDEQYNVSAGAREAIRAIGTNAIPAALRWISYEPSAVKEKTRPLTRLFPHGFRPPFLTFRDRRAIDAENLFIILGPEAAPAIPGLVRLAITSKGEARVGRCARSLEPMGPEGLAALIAMARNRQTKDRAYVMSRFLAFGPDAAAAVPTLLTSVQDADPKVAFGAATTLGMLGLSNSTVVPVLINTLQSTNAIQRSAAALCLARYGTNASYATPALREALADPDPLVRSGAAIALGHITGFWTNYAPDRSAP